MRYEGKTVSGLVRARMNGKHKCKSIQPGTLVQLTDEYHSMEALHGLVYVRPINRNDWLEGIAVRIEFLTPMPLPIAELFESDESVHQQC